MYGLILVGLTIPLQIALIPSFVNLRWLGLMNTPLAFGTYIMKGFFEGLPRELEEAARIDGSSDVRIFWQIMLPLTRPALATISIFLFLQNWNEFLFALTFITESSMRTLPTGIYALISSEFYGNYPLLAAGVSPMTVSRVLTGNGYVAEETAARVRDVLERLEYRPNPVADAVLTDGRDAARAAALYRLRRFGAPVAFVGLDSQLSHDLSMRDGYRDGMADAGFEPWELAIRPGEDGAAADLAAADGDPGPRDRASGGTDAQRQDLARRLADDLTNPARAFHGKKCEHRLSRAFDVDSAVNGGLAISTGTSTSAPDPSVLCLPYGSGTVVDPCARAPARSARGVGRPSHRQS